MNRTKNNIIIAITFLLILGAGILFKQQLFRLLPLFISLFVMTMQAKVSRYGYLLGGLNCILYTVVYLYLELYASAVSSLLFSCPIQLLTFFNWRRQSYQSSVILKKMSNKMRIGTGIGFLLIWVVSFTVLHFTGSQYAILDNTSSLLGIVVSVLTMLAYIEYTYLWVINSFLGLFLNLQVMGNDPSHITYVIYALFSLYCVIQSAVNAQKLYSEQQKEACSIN